MNHDDNPFHLLTESSPDAIFIGVEGHFRYLNPAALRLFGAESAAQLLGQSLLDRIHPDDREFVAGRIRQSREQGTMAPLVEERYLRLDGSVVEVEVAAVPFRYDGETGGLVFVRDITRRKQIESALERERAFLRQVIDSAPNVIFVKDRGGRYLLANEAAARAYGTTVEKMQGRIDTDFTAHTDEISSLHRDDTDVIDFGRGRLIASEAVTLAEGAVHWFRTSKTPLYNQNGECDKVLGVATDISEIKRAQAELQKNQKLLQSIIDNTTAVIFVKDLEGRYLLINRRYCDLFGITTDAMVGRTDADLFPAEVAEAIQAADRVVLAAGEPREFEEVVPHEDGPHTYLALKFPLRNEDGRPYALCGIATDITERQQHQEQVRALNQSLEQRVAARTRALDEAQARLREALELNENILMTSEIGIAAYHHAGRCVMANPAYSDAFGHTPAQALAQDFRTIPSWRDTGLLALAERVLAGGGTETCEKRFAITGASHIWLSCQLSRFASGGEPHLLVMIHDITEERTTKEALAESERHFRTLADNVPDNIMRCDCRGRLLYLNPSLLQTFGRASGELLGDTLDEIFPEGQLSALHETILRVGESARSEEIERRFSRNDGRLFYLEFRVVAERSSDGRPVSVLAVGRDVTQRRKYEEELRLAASVFHSSAEGVLVTDAAGTILSVNPAFSEITGYSEAEAIGRRPSLLRSERHEPEFYEAMWECLATAGCWQGEIWNRRKGGEAYLEWLTINRIDDHTGNPVRYVSVFHDITEMRRKDERIRHIAFHDALTGLPNRMLLQDRLKHALARAEREEARLSVTFIDLDRFKAINDSLGHEVGDNLLQEVGQRIKGQLRAMDTVARLGGDEFVVLMEDLEGSGACATLAEKLITEIARPMTLAGHTVEVGASMGIAFYPDDGTDCVELMKRADMAMYAAKEAGRNTYRFFQSQMLEHTSQRLALEMALRHAIAHDELELHYQPKVDLASGRPLGFEALVRWRHPERGVPAGRRMAGPWAERYDCRQRFGPPARRRRLS